MSAAIRRTDLSWPAMVAYEMGLTPDQFRFPTYEGPTGPGGLPVDLERLARAFERRFGPKLDFWEAVSAGLWVRSTWTASRTTGRADPGRCPRRPVTRSTTWPSRLGRPRRGPAHGEHRGHADHTRDRRPDRATGPERRGPRRPHRAESGTRQPRRPHRAGRRGGDGPQGRHRDPRGHARCQQRAGVGRVAGAVVVDRGIRRTEPSRTPSREGTIHGLAAVALRRRLGPDRGAAAPGKRPARDRGHSPVGHDRPDRPRCGWEGNPPVPLLPLLHPALDPRRGLRPEPGPAHHRGRGPRDRFGHRRPHQTIIDSVAAARSDGLDWYLFDLAGLFDRLATRRYLNSPWARPTWWTPYQLPPQLLALDPVPNTRFFRSGPQGRTDGGLFSLDGVHPTTIGYGLVAQELIRVMEVAGVAFAHRDGSPRPSPIEVDWDRILATDTLVSHPPAAIGPTLSLLGWLDERLDWQDGSCRSPGGNPRPTLRRGEKQGADSAGRPSLRVSLTRRANAPSSADDP